MTQLTPRTLPRPGRLLPGLAAAAAGGLLTGGFGAWAYYDDTFRPLAHSFGIWITLVVLLSARRSWTGAALRAGTGLGTAVLAFYVGKEVMYGIEYPGMPYALNRAELVEWLGLAVVAGALLGWVFSHVGRADRAGDVAAGAALGLLLGDAFRRGWNYDADRAVLLIGVLVCGALVLAVAVGGRDRRGRLGRVVLWSVPMAVLGVVLVSLPDALEQLMITGGL